jgi:hypothetical protein
MAQALIDCLDTQSYLMQLWPVSLERTTADTLMEGKARNYDADVHRGY